MPPKRNMKTKKENNVSSVEDLSSKLDAKRPVGKVNKPIQIAEAVVSETVFAEDPAANGAAKVELNIETEKPKSKGRSTKVTKADKTRSNGDDLHIDEKPAKRGRKAKNVDNPIPSEESKKNRDSVSVEKISEPEIEAKSKRGRKKKVAQTEEPIVIETVAVSNILQEEPPEKKIKKEVSKKKKPTKKTVTPSEAPPIERKARKEAEKKESVEEEPVENKQSRNSASKAEPKKVNEAVDSKIRVAGRTRVEKVAKRPVEEDLNNAPEVEDEPAPRRKREAPKKREASETEPKKKVAKQLQNQTATNFSNIDFETCQPTASGKMWNFKISSWNVDGIRAWVKKGGLEYIEQEKPDIICLQEVKCAQDSLPESVVSLPGYHPYWLCSDKDGYAGVGIYTKKMAIHVQYGLGDEDLDSEGRIITAEYEQFYLISTYVPNAGRKLVTLPKRLKWNDVFRQHVKELNKKKPVIICGDMNVAHSEIDLTNPKTNKKNAGFTQQERDGMTQLLGDGFVDTFRHLYPEQRDAYTFWTYMMNCRAKNIGWRLDYMIVSERLLPALCDSVIRDQIYGSDHCPITLFLHLNGFEKLSL